MCVCVYCDRRGYWAWRVMGQAENIGRVVSGTSVLMALIVKALTSLKNCFTPGASQHFSSVSLVLLPNNSVGQSKDFVAPFHQGGG